MKRISSPLTATFAVSSIKEDNIFDSSCMQIYSILFKLVEMNYVPSARGLTFPMINALIGVSK